MSSAVFSTYKQNVLHRVKELRETGKFAVEEVDLRLENAVDGTGKVRITFSPVEQGPDILATRGKISSTTQSNGEVIVSYSFQSIKWKTRIEHNDRASVEVPVNSNSLEISNSTDILSRKVQNNTYDY